MTNKQISENLKELALLMQLNNYDSFKVNSIHKAALLIETYPKELNSLAKEIINQIKGIGKSIAKKIEELISTNNLSEKQELLNKTPKGLFDLLKINGLGIKTIIKLWQDHNITNIEDLHHLLEDNILNNKKTFTLQKAKQLLSEIKFYESNKSKLLYPEAIIIAEDITDYINEKFQNAKTLIVGEIRRNCQIINSIEIISTNIEPNKLVSLLESYFKTEKLNIEDKGTTNCLSFLIHNIICQIYILKKDSDFTKEALIYTGSHKFVDYILNKIPPQQLREYNCEKDIFTTAGITYIPSALREDVYFTTIPNFPNIDISNLIRQDDIKGLLHNHSNYSDGKNSILDMANGCKSMGYEYFGLCDHSKSAFYASGLQIETITLQHQEIDKLNKLLSPFKILKGIEVDILQDGSLDYSDDILKSFDFVVASIHTGLNMDKETATNRIIKAISNKYVDILAHPTGRLLLKRKGYELDYKKIFEACIKYNVAIELNANPIRLDLDWTLIYDASKMGVFISINPDAHSINGLNNITYGINMAQKGLLNKNLCLNALGLKELLNKFHTNRI